MGNAQKIIIVGPAHPLRGGIATFNERLAQALQDDGHEVIIYTFSLQYPKILFPGKSQYTDDPAPEGLDIRVKVNSINPFNWLKVGAEIRDLKPDLVIMRFWIPFIGPSMGRIAKRIRSNGHSKVLVISDNIIPHEKRPGDRLLTNYMVRRVDGFIAMSRSVLKELDQFDAEKPRAFSPHPIYDLYGEQMTKEAAQRALGLPEGKRYILFFGFVRAYKGLDLLLEAMGDPRVKALDLHLLVAGEYYQDPKPYLDIIAKHGLEAQVTQAEGFIPNEDVGKYFCASDIVVQPYKSATQSGVTQIAYHFDKPMIVTNVGGLPEIVPDGKAGYVVPPEPADIADAIHRFYAEHKEAAFIEGVKGEKERFSWAHFVNEIFKLAETVKRAGER